MELSLRKNGEDCAIPTVALHGLLASARNWESVGRKLGVRKQVIALDLPDHGLSFHTEDLNYAFVVESLLSWQKKSGYEVIDLMGHSFGGKIAMLYALTYPENVRKLIVEDIAPKKYPARYSDLMEAMLEIDLEPLSSRRDVDQQLSHKVSDPNLRAFLLTNLVNEKDGLRWRANLRGILNAAEGLREFPAEGLLPFSKPSLFIYGEKSEYVDSKDEDLIKDFFPNAALHSISGAGHWVHAEKLQDFCDLADWFLNL